MNPLASISLLGFAGGLSALAVTAWKGALAVALAGLLCAALRRVPAAVRHAVWCTALAGVLLLPLLETLVPSWRLPLPARSAALGGAEQAGAAVLATGVATPAPQPAVPAPLFPGLLMVWAAGVLAVLLRLATGALRVARLGRSAAPLTDPSWTALLGTLRREAAVARPVTLLRASAETTPLTWGVLRPVILLPPSADAWTAERRRVVLLHELAHVARRDALSSLLAGLACAVHWFNPLVWFGAHRLRVESERACDDRVLSAGTRASDYAGHLLAIARGLRDTSRTGSAALAMAHPSQIESRLLAILAPGPRRRPTRLAIGAAVLLLAGALFPLAAASPAGPAAPDAGYSYQWADGGRRYAVQIHGEVELTADGLDVLRLRGAQASLIVEEGEPAHRRLQVRPAADGTPERLWTLDGTGLPYDGEAARWLAGVLGSFHREQSSRRDEMLKLMEREAEQRHQSSSPGASSTVPSPRPTEENAAVLGPDDPRLFADYLKREALFRERLLTNTGNDGVVSPLQQAREEVRRSQEKTSHEDGSQR